MGTVLKALLQERHLQTVSAFNREYDRIAQQVDPAVVGCGPGKAQFYRWLSGDIRGLPYPHHRRVLQTMFPDWTVQALFEFHSPDTLGRSRENANSGAPYRVTGSTADVEVVYRSRTEFTQQMPPHRLFAAAQTIDAIGISLNLLCQQVPDAEILRLLAEGTVFRCLFLDPADDSSRARDLEEGHVSGTLANLTNLNIQALRRIRERSSQDSPGRIAVRTYSGPPRFNLTIIDSTLCVMQPYLPQARGLESPTFVIRRSGTTGLFDTFSGVFEAQWESGQEISA